MEFYKKFGKSSWAKHLRNKKKSPFTKQMANKKSRAKSKLDLVSDTNDNADLKIIKSISNKFDNTEWTNFI